MKQLEIKYVPLSQIIQWERNPKEHDIGAIIESIRKHGFQDPPKYDATLGGIIAGNGRVESLRRMFADEPGEVPAGIGLSEGTGEWLIPIVFGNDLPSRKAAEAYAIDHNNITVMGGSSTVFDTAKMWDTDAYIALLTETMGEVVSVTPDEVELLMRAGQELQQELERPFAAMGKPPTITFGQFRIVISQEELEDLEQYAMTYESEHGGFSGFIQTLIGSL